MIKDFLKLIVGALAPFAYDSLKQKYPNYPLTKDNFTSQAIWLVDAFVPTSFSVKDAKYFIGVLNNAGIPVTLVIEQKQKEVK
ncbi:hypothetical protein [Flavobacterium sp.]|uniref:hypothetical protein n=1 Tax=Flavobacterium sp. TaxID=239 RepID=UPI002B4AD16D|nr:hypothetical protein [Flavobacterium sp.]HLF51512.1 hypothetical protein [Flavobacterium sp.]